MEQGLTQFTQMTGVNLKADLLAALGDTWCVYNSPGDGGLIFTGLTVTGTIRDRAKLIDANEKLVKAAGQALAAGPQDNPFNALGGLPSRTLISESEFRGQKIFFLNFVGEQSPFSPAWCITEKQIVFGLFPQTIKAYLQRESGSGAAVSLGTGKKSLANVPEVAELFASGGAPTVLSYQDTPNTFKFVYPLAQFFAQFAFSELQHQGIDLDMSILPNARAIMPHLKPNVFTVQSTKNGIRLETRGTLPTGMGGLPLAAAGFLLPATAAARAAAERTQSMNNLKQISLGLLNFEDQHHTFPPAFMADKNDKPLLSWRSAHPPLFGGRGIV